MPGQHEISGLVFLLSGDSGRPAEVLNQGDSMFGPAVAEPVRARVQNGCQIQI